MGLMRLMGLMGPEAAEAAQPITFHFSPLTSHLSLLTSHDIGVASTCGSLCCRSAIFRAAALTSA
jgi:hypothetical protein